MTLPPSRLRASRQGRRGFAGPAGLAGSTTVEQIFSTPGCSPATHWQGGLQGQHRPNLDERAAQAAAHRLGPRVRERVDPRPGRLHVRASVRRDARLRGALNENMVQSRDYLLGQLCYQLGHCRRAVLARARSARRRVLARRTTRRPARTSCPSAVLGVTALGEAPHRPASTRQVSAAAPARRMSRTRVAGEA